MRLTGESGQSQRGSDRGVGKRIGKALALTLLVLAAAAVLSPVAIDHTSWLASQGRLSVKLQPWLASLGVKLRPWLASLSAAIYAPSEAAHWQIGTLLLDLDLRAHTIRGVDTCEGLSRGAIAAAGQRLMLATCAGTVYEIMPGADSLRQQPLQLRVEPGEAALLAFAAGRSQTSDIWAATVRVHDLLVFAGGTRLAVSFNRWDAEKQCVALVVHIHDLPEDWQSAPVHGWREIFSARPCLPLDFESKLFLAGHQSGGRLAEGAPGKLLLTTGDFEFDGVHHAVVYPQDLAFDLGKIIEIDAVTGAFRHISLGHRNPQGLLVDSQGNIWVTEHGPRGGDELNLIEEGGNYGWPYATYGLHYELDVWPPARRQGRHDRFRPPAYAWIPSPAISNLIEINDFAPRWDGDLLVSSLKAKSLYRLRFENGRVVYQEAIIIGDRIRDIAQLNDGRIVLWTDSGRLLVLSPAKQQLS